MSLTEKQQAFCEHYAACLNATEAAKEAGYSEKTAYSIGAENLRKPEIQKYIQELIRSAQKGRIATIEEVLTYLSDTMRNEQEQTRERTKAAQLLREALADSSDDGREETGFVVSVEDFS